MSPRPSAPARRLPPHSGGSRGACRSSQFPKSSESMPSAAFLRVLRPYRSRAVGRRVELHRSRESSARITQSNRAATCQRPLEHWSYDGGAYLSWNGRSIHKIQRPTRPSDVGEHQEPCASQADLQSNRAWECARTGPSGSLRKRLLPHNCHTVPGALHGGCATQHIGPVAGNRRLPGPAADETAQVIDTRTSR